MGSLKCKACEANCNKCGTEPKSCFECARRFLLEAGECVATCTLPGYRANHARTQCINKSEFPFIGPVFSIASAFCIVIITIARCTKKETQYAPSLIAIIGGLEALAFAFQVFICIEYRETKSGILTGIAFAVYVLLNAYTAWFVQKKVLDENARSKDRIGAKKMKIFFDDILKKEKKKKAKLARRAELADRAMKKKSSHSLSSKRDGSAHVASRGQLDGLEVAQREELKLEQSREHEGGEIEMQAMYALYDDVGDSISQAHYSSSDEDDQYDGGDAAAENKDAEGQEGGMVLTPQLPPGMKVDPYAYLNTDPYGALDYKIDDAGDYKDPDSEAIKSNVRNAFGVLQRVADRYLRKEQIYREGSVGDRAYYRYKNIQDLGFKKWKEAYDQTFKWIRICSFVSFKAWRMSYSFFLGSKQFFCIF